MADQSIAKTQRPYQDLMSRMQASLTEQPEIDGFEVAKQVVDNIVTAATVDDVFEANEQGLPGLDDWDNNPITVVDVRWGESDMKYAKNSLGVYAIVEFFTADGEIHTASVGAPNVTASLFRFQELGFCTKDKPLEMKLVTKGTRNGTLQRVSRW